jgi:hypothetical protein
VVCQRAQGKWITLTVVSTWKTRGIVGQNGSCDSGWMKLAKDCAKVRSFHLNRVTPSGDIIKFIQTCLSIVHMRHLQKCWEHRLTAYIRFEVFTAVTMKNGVLWDVSRVALLRIDISEELIPFMRVARIGELGTTLAVTSTRCTLRASVAIYS